MGLGISGFESAPAAALGVLREADVVYVEGFTSPVSEADLGRVRDAAGGGARVVQARRWQVEDGREILDSARSGTVALVSYGDPYVATTHVELRTRAARMGIRTRSVHGSSVVTSAVGECGLHSYKTGRSATIMSEQGSLTTPYYTVYRNVVEGSHTVLLLEYSQERGGFFLDPGDALGGLLEAERGQARNVIGPSTYAIVASRIGLAGQAIVAGRVSSLRAMAGGFGDPPHTVIVPGSLHFTESDALRALATCIDEPSGNTERTARIAAQMLEKYAPMVRRAIKEEEEEEERRRGGSGGGHGRILENAELYVRDAERFLEDGQDEVAVLSIGYADGLVDALRMARGQDPGT